MNRKVYQIPDDQDVMIEFIRTIPDDWYYMNGNIYPPAQLIDDGKVAKDTGFQLARFSITPQIISRDCDLKNANLFDIMVEQKLPDFVYFDETGLLGSDINFVTSRDVAAGFVSKGYRGWLRYVRSVGKYMHEVSAECNYAFGSKPGASRNIEFTPSISFEWYKEHGGSKEQLLPVLSLCQKFGLKEKKTTSA